MGSEREAAALRLALGLGCGLLFMRPWVVARMPRRSEIGARANSRPVSASDTRWRKKTRLTRGPASSVRGTVGPGRQRQQRRRPLRLLGFDFGPRRRRKEACCALGQREGWASRPEQRRRDFHFFLFISRIFKWIFKRDLNSFSHATKTSPSQIKYAPA